MLSLCVTFCVKVIWSENAIAIALITNIQLIDNLYNEMLTSIDETTEENGPKTITITDNTVTLNPYALAVLTANN